MIPWLSPALWTGIAFAGVMGWGGIQTLRLNAAKADLRASEARYETFVQITKAEGERAQKAAKQAEEAAKRRAKEADDEAKKRYSSLDAQYAAYRMRQRASNGAGRSLLPAPAAGTPVDTRICYTRATLDRELGEALERLRGELAQVVEPYDRATLTARTCRDWAMSIQ